MNLYFKLFAIVFVCSLAGQTVTWALTPYVAAAIHPFFAQTAYPKECAGFLALSQAGASDQTIGAWALAHPECLEALNAANRK